MCLHRLQFRVQSYGTGLLDDSFADSYRDGVDESQDTSATASHPSGRPALQASVTSASPTACPTGTVLRLAMAARARAPQSCVASATLHTCLPPKSKSKPLRAGAEHPSGPVDPGRPLHDGSISAIADGSIPAPPMALYRRLRWLYIGIANSSTPASPMALFLAHPACICKI